MKLPLLLAGLTLSTLAFTAVASDNAGGCPCAGDSGSSAATSAPAAVDVGNTVCIVTPSDEEVTKTVEYKGKIYHLCCPMCLKKFNADPEKYIKAFEADPAKYGVKK